MGPAAGLGQQKADAAGQIDREVHGVDVAVVQAHQHAASAKRGENDPDNGSYGVRADLAAGGTIGSMRLELTGAKDVDQTENIVPYSLYGDGSGNLNGGSLPAGGYTLTATAYAEARLGGDILGTLVVSFSVTGPATEEEPNTPAAGAPTISGTAQVGETLAASISGIVDADGLINVAYSYQWIANYGTTDTEIQGATDDSYKLVADDAGKTIKVKVSFTDDANNPEELTSAPTAAVAPRPNSPATGLPTISGTAQVGETLTADTSGIDDADGRDKASFSHQWIAVDGTTDTEIQGATNESYTLVNRDFPDQTDFPEHAVLWDGSNYKTAY